MSCAGQDGSGDCSCGGFCAIPPAVALGWPKNIGHATAPQQAMAARLAQSVAQVAALSATGDELTADLVVTQGHKHNEEGLLLDWRQLGAWPVTGKAAATTVGQTFTVTANERLGLYFFRRPLTAGGVPIRNVIYPRARVSVPATGGPATSKLIITGEVVRVVAGLLVAVATLSPLVIGALAGPPVVSAVNRWFTWGAVEIPLAVLDARLALRLFARVDVAAQLGTVFEVAVDLRGGL